MPKRAEGDIAPSTLDLAAASDLVTDRIVDLGDRGKFAVYQVVDYFRGQIKATGVWTMNQKIDCIWFHRDTIANIEEALV